MATPPDTTLEGLDQVMGRLLAKENKAGKTASV